MPLLLAHASALVLLVNVQCGCAIIVIVANRAAGAVSGAAVVGAVIAVAAIVAPVIAVATIVVAVCCWCWRRVVWLPHSLGLPLEICQLQLFIKLYTAIVKCGGASVATSEQGRQTQTCGADSRLEARCGIVSAFVVLSTAFCVCGI